MKRNARLMLLIMLALFLMPVLAYASPLESFAENPIPYWVNGSSDGVNVTHDSDTATVLVDGGNDWEEDMSDVSDWTYGNNDSGHYSFTSDGSILDYNVTFRDSGNEYVRYHSDESFIIPEDGYIEFRYYVDNNTGVVLRVRLFDSVSEIYLPIDTQTSESWSVYRVYEYDIVDPDYDLGESCTIRMYVDDTVNAIDSGTYHAYLDYIHVGASNLSLAVPLEPDTTQSIELMGNFSALESTVRFQMYDNITAGIFCDVNSTQVTFPDSTYAEFNDFARINFTLDEERIIFKIYVYALNMTLINSYSSVVGPANNDYLFMTDSEFEGSYTLLYLQGDIGYLEEVIDTENIFYLLFLSLEMWGYLGPIALVVIGYFLVEKSVTLGVLWFIVECLFVANYLDLVGATPNYWWHIMILLLGGLFTCIFPLIDRK